MPYLIGPNSADTVPKRKRAPKSVGSDPKRKPVAATPAAAISAAFSVLATFALSKRSANSPPRPENRKDGAMKIAPASVTSASLSEPASLNRMKNTIAFFRKLSLKADKNCVQNKGANRRLDIKSNMTLLVALGVEQCGACLQQRRLNSHRFR